MLQNANINLETYDVLKLGIIIWEMKNTASLQTWLDRKLSQWKISLNNKMNLRHLFPAHKKNGSRKNVLGLCQRYD